MDEIVFQYFYLIKDRYKDVQIPMKKRKKMMKEKNKNIKFIE
jgi:hypothetical protein